MRNSKTIAVILAGGSGSRLGAGLPKQFVEIMGRSILEMTLDVFDGSPLIDQICIAIHPDCLDRLHLILERNSYRKPIRTVLGGSERYESSVAAIEACAGEEPDTILLFHDSVRPLVTETIISDCLSAMQTHEAVATGVPTTDTIWRIDDRHQITDIPPRADLYNAQTPQCFRLETIREAYRRALADRGFHPTDDCGVVRKYLPECPIFVVSGSNRNLKVTYKEDLSTLEILIAAMRPEAETASVTVSNLTDTAG